MPEIGATLREARMRERIDITEVEADTKIRGKYLRALENEEWDLLPGPTFVKSFLRTYADYLGLDGRMLVEEFKLRYERPELQPIVPPRGGGSRDRDRRNAAGTAGAGRLAGRPEAGPGEDLPDRRSGHRAVRRPVPARRQRRDRQQRHDVGLLDAHPHDDDDHGQEAHHQAEARRADRRAPEDRADRGRLRLPARRQRDPHQGHHPAGRAADEDLPARRLRLLLGNGSARLVVNGKTTDVPASANAIGYVITPTRTRRVPAAQGPGC